MKTIITVLTATFLIGGSAFAADQQASTEAGGGYGLAHQAGPSFGGAYASAAVGGMRTIAAPLPVSAVDFQAQGTR